MDNVHGRPVGDRSSAFWAFPLRNEVRKSGQMFDMSHLFLPWLWIWAFWAFSRARELTPFEYQCNFAACSSVIAFADRWDLQSCLSPFFEDSSTCKSLEEFAFRESSL
jgi:hypothetical protein